MKEQKVSKVPQIRFKDHSKTWRTESVSSLLSERNVQAPKSKLYPLMAFIAGQGVAPKGKRYNREFLVSDELNKKYKQTDLGDFIYSSNNLETGSIGTNNYGSASISPVYSIFSPTLEGDSSFIGQLLCKKAFINEMVKWRQGVVYGQWRIHESDFLKINATFPTIDEQTKIGEYFRELDSLIGLHQRKHDKLETLKKAMLQKMFPQPSAAMPEIRFKGYSGDWVEMMLGDICGSFEYGLNASAKEYDGRNKYIRITDIDESSHIFSQKNLTTPDVDLLGSTSYVLTEGDILFARTGASVGKTYRYQESDGRVFFAGFLIRAKALNPRCADFIFYATLTNQYDKFVMINSQRSGQPGINAREYSECIFHVPSVPEQQKIGTYFRTLDELISKHAIQLQKLQQIKSACLEKMFV